jgi:hypothetical protein
MSLKLSHLQQDPSPEVAAAECEAINVPLPADLQYTVSSLGQEDIDMSIGTRLAKRKLMQRTAEGQKKAAAAKDVAGRRRSTAPRAAQLESMHIDNEQALPEIGQMSLQENTNTQASTQTTEDKAARRHLQKMVR